LLSEARFTTCNRQGSNFNNWSEEKMQTAHRFLLAAVLALLSATSYATVVYTTSASFLAHVAPGSYTNTFTGLPDPPPGPAAFSGNGFAYSASAPGDIYLSGGFLGTSLPNVPLTINFTSGNIFAIGANFYATNLSDVFQAVLMSITLSDGTNVTFTPTSLSDSYRGFVSTIAITSLVLLGPGTSLYAGLDNLTVGRAALAVPEPATWLLVGLGLVGLLVARRRPV
jgi:hypothetical protein